MYKSISQSKNGTLLIIKAVPNSSKTQIKEINDNYIKITLKAKPVNNNANIELFSFLSKLLKIPKSNINIKSGKTNKFKLVEIKDVEAGFVFNIINEYLKNTRLPDLN